jgi:ubiquinone biosynthesis protein COQ9
VADTNQAQAQSQAQALRTRSEQVKQRIASSVLTRLGAAAPSGDVLQLSKYMQYDEKCILEQAKQMEAGRSACRRYDDTILVVLTNATIDR